MISPTTIQANELLLELHAQILNDRIPCMLYHTYTLCGVFMLDIM